MRPFPHVMRRRVPENYPEFADLPVTMIAARSGRERFAVHLSGRLRVDSPPLVCLAGYQRNMVDYADFLILFRRLAGPDPAVVLVDLPGRGRAEDRADAEAYASPVEAAELAGILAALGIASAVFLGQGHGGHVAMALAAHRPNLIAGAVLVDAGPVTDPRGLVRLFNNLTSLASVRGEAAARVLFRRIMASSYPGISAERADQLARRTHYPDRRGRPRPLFDPRLIKALAGFDPSDVLAAQWPLFEVLEGVPLMLLRTQLSDQLRRETFDEMIRRRPDATALIINGEGSPARLDHEAEVRAIAAFAGATAPD